MKVRTRWSLFYVGGPPVFHCKLFSFQWKSISQSSQTLMFIHCTRLLLEQVRCFNCRTSAVIALNVFNQYSSGNIGVGIFDEVIATLLTYNPAQIMIQL